MGVADLLVGFAHHFDAGVFEGLDFLGIVRQQAHFVNAKKAQHLDGGRVGAQIVGEAQHVVGFHGVMALLLQRIGLQLVQQADAAALLAEVEHHPAMLADVPQR